MRKAAIQCLSATIPSRQRYISLSASYIVLYIACANYPVEVAAVKFCSANSKAIQQAKSTLAPLQLQAWWLFGVDWQLADNKKRLACQTDERVRVHFTTNMDRSIYTVFSITGKKGRLHGVYLSHAFQ